MVMNTVSLPRNCGKNAALVETVHCAPASSALQPNPFTLTLRKKSHGVAPLLLGETKVAKFSLPFQHMTAKP